MQLMTRCAGLILALLCAAGSLPVLAQVARPTREPASIGGDPLVWMERRHAVTAVPSRILGIEFAALTARYEINFAQYFAVDALIGLPITDIDLQEHSAILSGLEAGVGARIYLGTPFGQTRPGRKPNFDFQRPAEWRPFFRVGVEMTNNKVAFDAPVRTPGERVERVQRVQATKRRREVLSGAGVRYQAANGLTLEFLLSLGLANMGLFADQGEDFRVMGTDWIFDRSEANEYVRIVPARLRFGIGYAF